MDGILWINRTGSPWRDLPEEFGKWGTVWDLFDTWTSDGTIDEYLLDLEVQPVIPSKENEDRDTRPVEFDKEIYRKRAIVEQLIGWLKESRRIFSRFEKTAINFAGFIKIAFMRRYLNLIT